MEADRRIEELIKKFEKWLRKYLLCYNCKKKCSCIQLNVYCEEQVKQAYIAGATEKDSVIERLKLNEQLAINNGKVWLNQLTEKDKQIEELKAQIEKMKICHNCKFEDNDYLEEPCCDCTRCLGDIKRNGNTDKWELAE